MDAVPDSSTDHAQRNVRLHTPDGSPSKQPADASKGAAGARKKQHSTPPIKDVRCSSLYAPACSMPRYKACRMQVIEALLNGFCLHGVAVAFNLALAWSCALIIPFVFHRHDQDAPEKHIPNGVVNGPAVGSEDRPGQETGSRGQQLPDAPPAGPASTAAPRASAAATPSSAGGNGPEGSTAAASCSFLLAKRKLAVWRRPSCLFASMSVLFMMLSHPPPF